MWKNWKEKVSNIFYEDIIDDEDEIDPVRVVNEMNYPQMRSSGTAKAKMTYEYPKEHHAPFRFPVIPDVQIRKKSVEKPLKTHNASRRHTEDRLKKPQDKKPLIRGFTEKEDEKDLENVPAYIRRRKRQEKVRKQEEVRHKEVKYEQINKIEVNHTSPDELDRIFKIRDSLNDKEIEEDGIELESKPNLSLRERVVPESVESVFTSDIKPLPDVTERTIAPREVVQVDPIDHHKLVNHKEVVVKSTPSDSEQNDVPNHLLNDPIEPEEDDSDWLTEQQSLLEQTLTHFNVEAKVVNVTQGPSVTRFEVQPALGVKVSRVRNLTDDIKLNMAAKDIRMEAPIPGKNTIGIEVPNAYPQPVNLQEIIETDEFIHASSPLTIALGLTIEGKPLITDIGKMPHGLIAGATGSGKSVCINTILLSLLYKSNHHEVKFLLIDPKMVELTPYNGIPHLIAPVITDAKAATMALKWAVDEMEDRYEKFVAAGVRNITKYNEKMNKENQLDKKLPYIVIVIDELADLMMVSPQEVEDAICRIAQKARACGMHLLLATQRPSVDVITGLIKANIPTRIAFSVSSQVDSRTMIDTGGAEKLLGKGDMLFVENGANKSVRLQGPFVSDEEIDRIANYMRTIAEPNYLFEQEQLLLEIQAEDEDELLSEVISFVVENDQASTSLLQRRFRIGYNRAARLIDTLEDKGIVSAQNGSKPREVLVLKNQIEELL